MSRSYLDIPPGIVADETPTTVGSAAYVDGDKVRFHRKRWQVIGGWERLVETALTGVCRTAFPWTDNIGALNVAFGTHSALQLYRGGALYTITPTRRWPVVDLPPDPLQATAASTLITVTHVGHGYATGDSLVVTGAANIGGVSPNGAFVLTVTGADSYTYNMAAPSAATAAGGGSNVMVQDFAAFTAGAEHGTGTAGFGTGAYSVGGYSDPSTADYFARTWSLDAYGESLMASPRGGTIYWWQNNTATPAAPLTNAPAQVSFMLVNDQRQVMAFGCNEELSGAFNPLAIRFSDLENPNEWTTTADNNAGEVILKGGGRLVGARQIGQYVFAWTDNALYVGTFIGDPSQTWRFEQVGAKCGLMGPNAAVVVGQAAYWITPTGQFQVCALGGAPEVLRCTVRNDFIGNLTASQAEKVVASSCAQFGEIRFDYPDQRDGFENSRYLALCLADAAWTRGQLARSAFVDAGPSVSPIGVAPTGEIYWHERGQTADGQPLSWFIESGDQYISGDRQHMFLRDIEPDFEAQVGPVSLTLMTRDYAQSAEESWGPYDLPPGLDFMDLRASGRFVRARFEGASVPSFARVGRPSFDAVGMGAR